MAVEQKREELTSISWNSGFRTRASLGLVSVRKRPRRVDSASVKPPALRISLYVMPDRLDRTRYSSLLVRGLLIVDRPTTGVLELASSAVAVALEEDDEVLWRELPLPLPSNPPACWVRWE